MFYIQGCISYVYSHFQIKNNYVYTDCPNYMTKENSSRNKNLLMICLFLPSS
jgi:hypothetical protein